MMHRPAPRCRYDFAEHGSRFSADVQHGLSVGSSVALRLMHMLIRGENTRNMTYFTAFMQRILTGADQPALEGCLHQIKSRHVIKAAFRVWKEVSNRCHVTAMQYGNNGDTKSILAPLLGKFFHMIMTTKGSLP